MYGVIIPVQHMLGRGKSKSLESTDIVRTWDFALSYTLSLTCEELFVHYLVVTTL